MHNIEQVVDLLLISTNKELSKGEDEGEEGEAITWAEWMIEFFAIFFTHVTLPWESRAGKIFFF